MKMTQPAGRPHKLARRLEVAILDKDLKPNERLPTERALAERWKVSRSTVREALGLLVAKGLLTRRQGDGTYVNDPTERLDVEVWSDMARHYPDLQSELLEFRHILECRAAELAALRHNASDRKKLEAAAVAVEAAYVSDDHRAQLDADYAFHRVIAESAHNPLFTYLMNSLQKLMSEHMRLSLAGLGAVPSHTSAVRKHHAHLLKTILDRDAAGAAIAAGDHLDYVRVQINHLDPAKFAGR